MFAFGRQILIKVFIQSDKLLLWTILQLKGRRSGITLNFYRPNFIPSCILHFNSSLKQCKRLLRRYPFLSRRIERQNLLNCLIAEHSIWNIKMRLWSALLEEEALMYEEKYLALKKVSKWLLMNSTESKIGLLLEDAQTALERGVKRGAVKMDIQLEIR